MLGIRALHNRNFKKHNVRVPTSHFIPILVGGGGEGRGRVNNNYC